MHYRIRCHAVDPSVQYVQFSTVTRIWMQRTPKNRSTRKGGLDSGAFCDQLIASRGRRRDNRRNGRPGVEEDGVVQLLVPLGAVGGVVAVVAEELLSGAQCLWRSGSDSHCIALLKNVFTQATLVSIIHGVHVLLK